MSRRFCATVPEIMSAVPKSVRCATLQPLGRLTLCLITVCFVLLAGMAARADGVVIGPVFTKPQDPIATEELFSPAELTADLQQLGKKAHAGQGIEEIVSFLTEQCRAGDVVLVMSNGAFGGLPRKLLATLQAQYPETCA